jgi:hypothetical protein
LRSRGAEGVPWLRWLAAFSPKSAVVASRLPLMDHSTLCAADFFPVHFISQRRKS